MMKYNRIISLFCVVIFISAILTGCGDKANSLMECHPAVSSVAGVNSLDNSVSTPLSKGVCVIPKKSQTKYQDYMMTSKASLMINESDGKMLYSHNIYAKIYPASITKIVTAYVALKYGKLDDVVTVSYNASHITESGAVLCGIQEGDKIVLRDLLNAFLVRSGNDAGIAIAEHIAGSEKKFANLMNREMKAIGAINSHFVNPHGLHDEKHYTTAYDLYLIFRRLIKNETFVNIVSQGTYTLKYKDANGKAKSMSYISTDRYLIGRAYAPGGVEVIGGKTGTTFMAGSCLILYSQNTQGKKFISVVLKASGGDDLYLQMNNLLGYAVPK